MKRIIINGPNKLSGSVNIQGAKNIANKLIFLPLFTNEICTIKNVPRIGTIETVLRILKRANVSTKWIDKHTIPSDLFLHTSAGIHAIPIIASKFEKCIIQKEDSRDDYGGDQIGSRKIDYIIKTLEECGISCKETSNLFIFQKESNKPFTYNIPDDRFLRH